MRHEPRITENAEKRPAVIETPVTVITRNMATGETVDARLIDHSFFSDRQWLGNHSFWALRNGHGVQTAPATEEEIASLPLHVFKNNKRRE